MHIQAHHRLMVKEDSNMNLNDLELYKMLKTLRSTKLFEQICSKQFDRFAYCKGFRES